MGFKSKLHNFKDCAVNSMIYREYYKDGLDDNLVYLESRDGLDFTGNIFRIVEELSTGKYGNLRIHVHAKPQVVDKIKALEKNYNLKIDKIITKEATATKTLEKAKYIFTDAGIRPKYVKKEGQIFINTWHGTPLKLMGKDNIAEEHRLGNAQHPMLSSDYLLYPNEYMMEKMLNAFMIEKIFPGKILLEGYPRNSVFFEESSLKDELNLREFEIFVYMPTFRGILMDRDDDGQKNKVEKDLSEIDSKLNDNQILFAKLHVLNESGIDFSKFNHIRAFPEGYEIYDVLNMADVLITDYSSVFFDFANTRRKIILFNYDEKDYESYRGFYFPLSDLPFPKVQTIDDLICEINSPVNYDDSEFIQKFCSFDNPKAAENICKTIFNGECASDVTEVKNNNPNILIFAGALNKFNNESPLFNLLSSINRKQFNCFITFKQWEENIIENHEEIFKLIPQDVEVLPLRFDLTPTVKENDDYNKYFSSTKVIGCPHSLRMLFKRSFEKQFGSVKWDMVIDFDGCNPDVSLMFAFSGDESSIWIHSDTECDSNTNVSKEIYSRFDNVFVDSSDFINQISQISGRKDNIKLIFDFKEFNSILNQSDED